VLFNGYTINIDIDIKFDADLWSAHSDDDAIGELTGPSGVRDANIAGSGYDFNGRIDEVELFNMARDAAVIAGHYATGSWLSGRGVRGGRAA
jgi:hypothetical protein